MVLKVTKKNHLKKTTMKNTTPTAVKVHTDYLAKFEKAMHLMRYQGICFATCTAYFDFVEDAVEMADMLREDNVPFSKVQIYALNED